MTVGLLATNPALSLHHVCYNFTSLFISYYAMGLRVDVPVVPAHFFINLLLRVSLVHFPHLYLFWLVGNIPAVPTHFYYFIPWASSAHLFPLYLFYSYGIFAKFFGLLWSNYYIFTSYYFLGLLAFKPNH